MRLLGLAVLVAVRGCGEAQSVDGSKTEIFDAPEVRVETVNGSTYGFYVSKTHDLRLRCVIRLPSSVRLSEKLRQIVWRYNDEVLIKAGLPAGAFLVDGDRLVLNANVEAELLVGKYSCNVTWSSYGSVLSPPVHVEFANLKKFKIDPPPELRVLVGQTAYIPCHTPESNPGPAKISLIANQTLEITTDIVSDRYFLTPTGLQIGRVEKSDQGQYVCRATNAASSQSRDSRPIDLIILDDDESVNGGSEENFRPSSYLNQRNALDVRKGDNVTFECLMVSEVGRTSNGVRWEKYGSVLPPVERRRYVFGNMILNNVSKEDEGTYICRADSTTSTDRKQSSSSSQSRFIMYFLRVHDPLRAKLTIERDTEEDKSATSGLAYRLTCQASTGLASDLEFCVNGRPLLSQSLNPLRTHFQSGESPTWSFTLTESSLRQGVYQCMVRGREPFDRLTVDSDNLYVESSFVPRISGRKEETDDTMASGMEEPSIPTRSNGHHLPRIIIAPENETTAVGLSVTFVCQVSSNTDVVYWLKDGSRIFDYDPNEEDDEEEEVEEEHNRYKRIGTASLNIENTNDHDRGWYTCVAANSYGNSTAKAYLDFEGFIVIETRAKPTVPASENTMSTEEEEGEGETNEEEEKPKNKGRNGKRKKIRLEAPAVFRYSNTSVHLRWTLTSEQRKANTGIRFFKLQYKMLNKGEGEKDVAWRTLDQELPSHSHSGTIDGLEPGRKYKFRYAVVYDNNYQALSRMTAPYEMTVERKQNAPKMPPTLTSVKTISWSAISLHWDYPPSEQAPVDGFVIMYRRIYYTDTSPTFQDEKVIGGWTREHVLSHLLPATLYQIKMMAFNTAGQSRESNVVNESTLSSDGTKRPRTFDGVGPMDRLFSAVASNRPTMNSRLEGTNDAASDPGAPPVSSDRAEKGTSVFGLFNVNLEMLFYIVGGVMGAMLVLCLIVVAVRYRKQRLLVKAANGKYRDTSKKIYKEQALCNDPSVMKEMYRPVSNSVSFQQSAGESCDEDNDHGQCPPQSGTSQANTGRPNGSIPPPPPSLTGYSNGNIRPGLIMNLYPNPFDCNDNLDSRGSERRYGLLNKTTTEFTDGEEADGLLSAKHALEDMNKNDVRYGLTTAPLNGLNYRRVVPPPLILTSASALTSTSPFGTSGVLSSPSPHASVASNYSSSNPGDVPTSSMTFCPTGSSNHTPLLPPPMFTQQVYDERASEDRHERQPKRIPTPVPNFNSHQNTSSSPRYLDHSKVEKRRGSRLDSTASARQHPNGGLNGAASPMSVSSHASIGSGSAASASGSRPNFSTFKPDPNRQTQGRHHSRNNLLLYNNRLSDGYCSDN